MTEYVWHHRRFNRQVEVGMNAHIAVNAEQGLLYTASSTVANEHKSTKSAKPSHGDESDVFADLGYLGANIFE